MTKQNGKQTPKTPAVNPTGPKSNTVTPPSSISIDDPLSSLMTNKVTVCWNLDQNVIVVTEDKLLLRLREYLPSIEARKGWITPLGILATLCVSLCTQLNYKDFLWLEASRWEAIFSIAFFLALLWSINAIVKAYNSKSITVKTLLEDIKKSGETGRATFSFRSAPMDQDSDISLSETANIDGDNAVNDDNFT